MTVWKNKNWMMEWRNAIGLVKWMKGGSEEMRAKERNFAISCPAALPLLVSLLFALPYILHKSMPAPNFRSGKYYAEELANGKITRRTICTVILCNVMAGTSSTLTGTTESKYR